MATTALQTIKSWFVRGAKPTAAQFASAFDSFWHKLENIPISAITNLQSELNAKANTTDVNTALAGKASASHTHTKSQISDFSHTHTLSDISNVNDLYAICKAHSYTLDFGSDSEMLQDINTLGAVTINRIITNNVAALKLSYGNVVRQAITPGNNLSIAIPDGSLLVWEIVRTNEDSPACVGIRIATA